MSESDQSNKIRSYVEGDVAGRIAAGGYLLEVGSAHGAVARPHGAPRLRPRRVPVVLRPRPLPGLLDREAELNAVLSGLRAGVPVELHGPEGVGKTSLLRALAHHPEAGAFGDGVAYLRVRRRHLDDVLQGLVDTFFETDLPVRVDETQARHALGGKAALLLLDDLDLELSEVDRLLDCAPSAIFVLASRSRRLWGEGRAVALGGLPEEAALELVARELGRPLGDEETLAAQALCASLGGHPVQIQEAVARLRIEGQALGAVVGRPGPIPVERLAEDDASWAVLSALALVDGAPLAADHLQTLAGPADVRSALDSLGDGRLVRVEGRRYRMSGELLRGVRRVADLASVLDHALDHFAAWASGLQEAPARVVAEGEALAEVLAAGAAVGRWEDVLRLGRAVEGSFALTGQWGSWGAVLRRCLEAARRDGDPAAEGWALHQEGTRALCSGDAASARASLGRALELRRSVGDEVGATLTRHNLELLAALPAAAPGDASLPSGEVAPAGEGAAPEDAPAGPPVAPPRVPQAIAGGEGRSATGEGPADPGRGGFATGQAARPEGEVRLRKPEGRPAGPADLELTHRPAAAPGGGPELLLRREVPADAAPEADETPAAGGPEEEAPAVRRERRRKPLVVLGVVLGLAALVAAGVLVWRLSPWFGVPEISLDPERLTFGPQQVGTQGTPRSVTLSAQGRGSVRLRETELAGEAPADFTVVDDGCADLRLTAGESCTVAVHFNPTETGDRSADLAVIPDTADPPYTVSLAGTGTQPRVTLAPSRLDFGEQPLGTTGGDRAVELTNSGTSELVVDRVSVTGRHAGDFRLRGDACSGATLGPEESCGFRVSFAPGGEGGRNAAVTVTHSAPSGPHSVPVAGLGTDPRPVLSQASLTFGEGRVGRRSEPLRVTVSNEGTGSLAIREAQLAGESPGDFTLVRDGCTRSSLSPGEGCTVEVAFAPESEGERQAVLAFVHNAAGELGPVPLAGIGTAPRLAVDRETLVFGGQLVGERSRGQRVSLSNAGSGRLAVEEVALGEEGAGFLLSEDGCSGTSLEAGESCAVAVTFAPRATGARRTDLTIVHDAAEEPLILPVSGAGTEPRASFDPAGGLRFGDQQVGEAGSPRRLTVANLGSGPLEVRRVEAQGSNPGDFQVVGDGCSGRRVAPGESCILQVAFAPLEPGERSAALALAHNGPESPRTVPLSGFGTAPRVSLSTETLSFGALDVGSRSGAEEVSVFNAGRGRLDVREIAVSGPQAGDFAVAGEDCAGRELAPHRGCSIRVTFSPQAGGERTASLVVSHNSGDGESRVALRGRGNPLLPEPELSAGRLDFGSRRVGGEGLLQSVTLTNRGAGPLEVGRVSLGGEHATDFVLYEGCSGGSLAPGESCEVEVGFVARARGARSATLVLELGPGLEPARVPLAGSGG